MRAVITAGARISGAYAQAAGTHVKALASVRGETMLARAIRAARDAGSREVAVVGGSEVGTACNGAVERVISEGASGAENVARALHAWPDDDALLYLASDMPYADGSAIAEFVSRSGGRLAIALAEDGDYVRRFPNAPPAGIRLGRDRVVNGDAFVVPAGAAERVAALAARFFDARKHPLRMAALAGPDLLVRFVLGLLDVGRLERRTESVLGIAAQAVRGCAPELAFDADSLAEYRYACEHA